MCNNLNDDFLCYVQNVLKTWESEYCDLLLNLDTNYNPGNIHNDSLNTKITLNEI